MRGDAEFKDAAKPLIRLQSLPKDGAFRRLSTPFTRLHLGAVVLVRTEAFC